MNGIKRLFKLKKNEKVGRINMSQPASKITAGGLGTHCEGSATDPFHRFGR